MTKKHTKKAMSHENSHSVFLVHFRSYRGSVKLGHYRGFLRSNKTQDTPWISRDKSMKRFKLGRICWTGGINEKMADDERFAKFVLDSLKKYRTGNWGNVCDEDKQLNDEAVSNGSRILGAYEGMYRIWIITEADRSCTTILFPDEY